MQTSNGKPATVTLVNKYKALDGWMSNPYNYSKEIWCGQKHSFTEFHAVKKDILNKYKR